MAQMRNALKATSAILAKFQTTVPPLVRDWFDLREGDLLEWGYDSSKEVLVVRPMRASLIPPKGVEVIRQAMRADAEGQALRVTPADLDERERAPAGAQSEKND